MLTTTLSFAVALATVSNAISLELRLNDQEEYDENFQPPAGIKIDDEEPPADCCFFYGAPYYQVEETDSGNMDYYRGKKCLSRGMFGNGGPYITPYSFVKEVDD